MDTPVRSRRALTAFFCAFLLIALTACRREPSRLGSVQKMAYGVKPAVVRVVSFATATFAYRADDIRRVESQLRSDGIDAKAQGLTSNDLETDTGTGGSGSGFVIDASGFVVTNGHVVAATLEKDAMQQSLLRNGAVEALSEHFPVATLRTLYRSGDLDRYIDAVAERGSVRAIKVTNEVDLSNGDHASFAIRKYSPALAQGGFDIAVLKIERRELPTIQLGDSESVQLQEPIWTVGYPAVASSGDDEIGRWLSRGSDLEATFNPGTITSIKRDSSNTTVFQTNSAVYPGNSGGPAVDADGNVIGIVTWGHTEADQIKFLVPVNVAKKILIDTRVPFGSEGAFNRSYHQALEAAASGDWLVAQRELKRANTLFPNSPDVIRFMKEADANVKTLPSWQLHRSTMVVAIAAALLAAVGLILLFGRSKTVGTETVLPARGSLEITHPAVASHVSILGRFTILNGDRAGQKLGLGGSGIRIGRESEVCEIVLQNPKVSRLHAEVVAIDGKVLLIDRNSSNGTYVNDRRIERQVLRDGDIIYFGGRNAVAVAFNV